MPDSFQPISRVVFSADVFVFVLVGWSGRCLDLSHGKLQKAWNQMSADGLRRKWTDMKTVNESSAAKHLSPTWISTDSKLRLSVFTVDHFSNFYALFLFPLPLENADSWCLLCRHMRSYWHWILTVKCFSPPPKNHCQHKPSQTQSLNTKRRW